MILEPIVAPEPFDRLGPADVGQRRGEEDIMWSRRTAKHLPLPQESFSILEAVASRTG